MTSSVPTIEDLLERTSLWRKASNGRIEHLVKIKLMDEMDILPTSTVIDKLINEVDVVGFFDPMLAIESFGGGKAKLILRGWAPATSDDIEAGLRKVVQARVDA